eukprot:scaffold4600_cov74-Phaeocystis_antarctica.AAC.6
MNLLCRIGATSMILTVPRPSSGTPSRHVGSTPRPHWRKCGQACTTLQAQSSTRSSTDLPRAVRSLPCSGAAGRFRGLLGRSAARLAREASPDSHRQQTSRLCTK